MQCSGCQGSNFQHVEGRLVCDDCGEELIGFQEEEEEIEDFGCNISSARVLQSARHNYEALKARRDSQHQMLMQPKAVSQMLVYEASLHILKGMTDRLIQLKYLSSKVREPLFQIWGYWVRRKHASAPYQSRTVSPDRTHYLLAMVSLAASYTRAPMLPRDVCRLAATRQIPFMTALATEVSAELAQDETVRKVLATDRLPVPRKVILAANNLALGPFSWPPLKRLYAERGDDGIGRYVPSIDGNGSTSEQLLPIVHSFPLGHESVTLLRLTSLLGLPDEFGARVLRWRELRDYATRMAMKTITMREGHESQNQYYNNFGSIPSQSVGRATEDGLMIDVVNTLRICYGRRLCYGGTVLSKRDEVLKREWDGCKAQMNNWLHNAGRKMRVWEDIDIVLWCELSPQLVRSLRGKPLLRYSQLVSAMLEQRGENGAELWGPFLREFENIAYYGMGSDGDEERQESNGESKEGVFCSEEADRLLRVERECIYNESRYGGGSGIASGDRNGNGREGNISMCEEELRYMEEECGLSVSGHGRSYLRMRKLLLHSTGSKRYLKRLRRKEQTLTKDSRLEANSNRDYNSSTIHQQQQELEELSEDDFGAADTARQVSSHEFNWVWEPSGIGLAWTMLMTFFEGGRMDMGLGKEKILDLDDFNNRMRAVVAACNRTMRVTMKYVVDYSNINVKGGVM